MKLNFEQHMDQRPELRPHQPEFLSYFSREENPIVHLYLDCFVSGVYVTMEGYDELKCQVDAITTIRNNTPNFMEHMKGYRNSTCHFETMSERTKKMSGLELPPLQAIYSIHNTVGQYLLDFLKTCEGTKLNMNPSTPNRSPSSLNLYPCKHDLIFDFHRFAEAWIRADEFRKKFYRQLGYPQHHGTYDIDLYAYLDYWYAFLYILIEGYKKLGLRDSNIDNTLNGSHSTYLKKYRHAVFDFKKDYGGVALKKEFLTSEKPVEWVSTLHESFRVFIGSELGKSMNSEKGALFVLRD